MKIKVKARHIMNGVCSSSVLSSPLPPQTTESGFGRQVRYGVGRSQRPRSQPGFANDWLCDFGSIRGSKTPLYMGISWGGSSESLCWMEPVSAGLVPVPTPASLGTRIGRHSDCGQLAPSILPPAPQATRLHVLPCPARQGG